MENTEEMERAIELPLEVQVRLARWKLEIEKLNIEELRMLYMMLAKESAQKQVQYEAFLRELIASDRASSIKISEVEKKCAGCERRLFNLLCTKNPEQ